MVLYEKVDVKLPEGKKKHLISVASDRGLRGADHFLVDKQMKSEVARLPAARK